MMKGWERVALPACSVVAGCRVDRVITVYDVVGFIVTFIFRMAGTEFQLICLPPFTTASARVINPAPLAPALAALLCAGAHPAAPQYSRQLSGYWACTIPRYVEAGLRNSGLLKGQ